MPPTAIIVGAAGQDGTLLGELLRARGYLLLGLGRDVVRGDWKGPVDITRASDVLEVVGALRPDEIYHLAAVHHSSEESARPDLAFFRRSYEVNFFSLLNVLEAVRLHSPATRVFYAASSHVFGAAPRQGTPERQTEETPFAPQSVYAMTKVDGVLACRQYRTVHGIFAATGILFNHESRLRPEKYLSRKVIRAVAAASRGAREPLVLGDLAAEVDWGYAPDYVEAMAAILGARQPDDFIVATGRPHTVRELVAAAFAEAGLDWTRHVVESPAVIERRPQGRIGNPSKLTRVTGWTPKTDFFEMVRLLVRQELETTG